MKERGRRGATRKRGRHTKEEEAGGARSMHVLPSPCKCVGRVSPLVPVSTRKPQIVHHSTFLSAPAVVALPFTPFAPSFASLVLVISFYSHDYCTALGRGGVEQDRVGLILVVRSFVRTVVAAKDGLLLQIPLLILAIVLDHAHSLVSQLEH